MKFFFTKRNLTKTVVSPEPPEVFRFENGNVTPQDRLPPNTGYSVVEFLSDDGRLYFRIGVQRKVPFLPLYYWSWVRRLRQDSDGCILGENWDSLSLDSAIGYVEALKATAAEKERVAKMQKLFTPRVIFPYFNM